MSRGFIASKEEEVGVGSQLGDVHGVACVSVCQPAQASPNADFAQLLRALLSDAGSCLVIILHAHLW